MLEQYGVSPSSLASVLLSDPRVHSYVIFIAEEVTHPRMPLAVAFSD